MLELFFIVEKKEEKGRAPQSVAWEAETRNEEKEMCLQGQC